MRRGVSLMTVDSSYTLLRAVKVIVPYVVPAL